MSQTQTDFLNEKHWVKMHDLDQANSEILQMELSNQCLPVFTRVSDLEEKLILSACWNWNDTFCYLKVDEEDGLCEQFRKY